MLSIRIRKINTDKSTGSKFPVLQRNAIAAVISVVIASGLATLPISPMPWFDEVYFASITESYLDTGEFKLGINPLRAKQELTYGPIFFFIQGVSFQLLGFGVFQARLPGFISGLGIALLMHRLLRGWGVSKGLASSVVITLLADYMFGRGMHSGRMDLIAVFFVFVSLLMIDRIGERAAFGFAFAGIFSGLAVLTTPRICFAVFGLPFFLVSIANGRAQILLTIRNAAVFIAGGFLPLTVWFLVAFGEFSSLLEFYTSERETSAFLGFGGFFRHRFEYHIYTAFVIALAVFIRNMASIELAEKLRLAGLSFAALGYNCLVTENGPYSAMIIPIYLCFCGVIYAKAPLTLQKAVMGLVITVSIFLFVGKKTVVLAEFEGRVGSQARTIVRENGGGDQVVLGDYEYYYLLRISGATFAAWKTIDTDLGVGNSGVSEEAVTEYLEKVSLVIVDLGNVNDFKSFADKFGFTAKEQKHSKGFDDEYVDMSGGVLHKRSFMPVLLKMTPKI